MKFKVKGRLQAAVCDENTMVVANTTLRIYNIAQNINEATAYTAAQSKEVAQVFEEKEIKDRSGKLLVETTTDAEGNYEFEIDDQQQEYSGGAMAVSVYYKDIPNYGQENTDRPKGFTTFEVLLNVIQPRWEQTENGLIAGWNYQILHRIWCYILKRLDIWVICGTLRNCKSQEPIQGIDVIAMDDDIITDDRLGMATTDANGRFCIYYRSADFKKTFLSPFINIETTPFLSPGYGPDIYFKYALGGDEFAAESHTEAHKASRRNVGNCVCVHLCLEDAPTIPNDGEFVSAFYNIGHTRRYHPVLNIDPVTGRTTGKLEAAWNEQAFYSTILLLGSLTAKFNGQPTEYKFQYATVADPSTPTGSIPDASWNDVTESLIAKTIIGDQLVNNTDPSLGNHNYVIQGSNAANSSGGTDYKVSFNGNWIEVPQTPGINFDGSLIRLKTADLTGGEVDKGGLVPGASSGPLESNTYIALRMFKREAGNMASETMCGFSRPLALFNTQYKDVPQGGTWDPAGKDTELGIATLDLQELVDGGSCAKIETTLQVNYTAANPNLGAVSLVMYGPGGPHSFDPITYTTPGQEAHGSSQYTGNVEELPNCAFEIKLFAELNLTNGEQQHHTIQDRVLYCKLHQE
ncbi:transthyretin-like family protein [Cochleicola gelatinilyticus]|uniref:Carboxypeptidase regulatory-like domain-containing protein n=1 Tax=Cochleicola gelatinilyticus TaxID=1763537 RepID=A0A167J3N1_9FLAO|nr:hypothetical protein [Cochleicola gelatinilyticus]OAB80299.1 hypothetical protein ULVI_06065 [Cochleicola gelatinilyticus]